METMEPNAPMGIPHETGFKQRLGDFGRRIKRIDLRQEIAMRPFPAVGIAAAAGALVGILRPRPRPHRMRSALVSAIGLIGYRLVREAAMAQGAIFLQELFKSPPTTATTAGTTTPAY